jgi:hypothetical protein
VLETQDLVLLTNGEAEPLTSNAINAKAHIVADDGTYDTSEEVRVNCTYMSGYVLPAGSPLNVRNTMWAVPWGDGTVDYYAVSGGIIAFTTTYTAGLPYTNLCGDTLADGTDILVLWTGTSGIIIQSCCG